MNKNFFLLAFLLLLVPACKKSPRYSPAPCTGTTAPAHAPENAEFDEELGAFVVKDDENKFSSATAAQDQEEELSATTTEQMAGDSQTDSARYGLKNITFEFNKYRINDLRPDQVPVLEHDLAIVKSLANKGYKISIEGHACNSAGSTEYNMMLSEDRARAVAEFFKAQGVTGDLYTIGHGATNLLVPSGNREQQAPNRRVEIYAYPANEAASVS